MVWGGSQEARTFYRSTEKSRRAYFLLFSFIALSIHSSTQLEPTESSFLLSLSYLLYLFRHQILTHTSTLLIFPCSVSVFLFLIPLPWVRSSYISLNSYNCPLTALSDFISALLKYILCISVREIYPKHTYSHATPLFKFFQMFPVTYDTTPRFLSKIYIVIDWASDSDFKF